MPTNNPSSLAPYVPSGLPSGFQSQTSLASNNPNSVTGQNGPSYLLNDDPTPDELSSLLPLSLKRSANEIGVAFPGVYFREEQSKSLAVHLYPNLDSARVENMGRNPAVFHVRAMLTNNIYPGKNESWIPGDLFPNTFIALLNILNDNSCKVLQHPVYGNITVQVQNYTYDLNPKGPRDGAIVEMSFIETIGDNNPLSDQISPPTSTNLLQAANGLDDAIDLTDDDLNLPGLSLSQFFGQVNNLVNQVVATPNNLVNSLNEDIVSQVVTGVSSVGSGLVKAPATIANNTAQAIQDFKNTVLNSPLQNAVSYDEATYTAMQSILSLNNTPSQNAFQFINKQQRGLVDLQQHYINQNNAQCSPVIEAIRQLLYQLQQLQSSLTLNSQIQNVVVSTYVTRNPITWMSLARMLNNDIGSLMQLNQGLINDMWLPGNTTINYYQG